MAVVADSSFYYILAGGHQPTVLWQFIKNEKSI